MLSLEFFLFLTYQTYQNLPKLFNIGILCGHFCVTFPKKREVDDSAIFVRPLFYDLSCKEDIDILRDH